jgi:hypothetical protein
MIENLIGALLGLEIDERFVAHRYYSSRLALIAGMILILAWFSYGLVEHDRIRWDFLIIAGVMALTKLAAMAYFRLTR